MIEATKADITLEQFHKCISDALAMRDTIADLENNMNLASKIIAAMVAQHGGAIGGEIWDRINQQDDFVPYVIAIDHERQCILIRSHNERSSEAKERTEVY